MIAFGNLSFQRFLLWCVTEIHLDTDTTHHSIPDGVILSLKVVVDIVDQITEEAPVDGFGKLVPVLL